MSIVISFSRRAGGVYFRFNHMIQTPTPSSTIQNTASDITNFTI